jgi:hypothetical protein
MDTVRINYSMFPTTLTKNRVPIRTFLMKPFQGTANALNARTSSRNLSRNVGEEVTKKNDSSVSRLHDRELKLVDPKRVRIGAASGVGENQMPVPICEPWFLRWTEQDLTFCMIRPAVPLPFGQLNPCTRIFFIACNPASSSSADGPHENLL